MLINIIMNMSIIIHILVIICIYILIHMLMCIRMIISIRISMSLFKRSAFLYFAQIHAKLAPFLGDFADKLCLSLRKGDKGALVLQASPPP